MPTLTSFLASGDTLLELPSDTEGGSSSDEVYQDAVDWRTVAPHENLCRTHDSGAPRLAREGLTNQADGKPMKLEAVSSKQRAALSEAATRRYGSASTTSLIQDALRREEYESSLARSGPSEMYGARGCVGDCTGFGQCRQHRSSS